MLTSERAERGNWGGGSTRHFMKWWEALWGGFFSAVTSRENVFRVTSQGHSCTVTAVGATSCQSVVHFSNCMTDPALSKGVKERVWFSCFSAFSLHLLLLFLALTRSSLVQSPAQGSLSLELSSTPHAPLPLVF